MKTIGYIDYYLDEWHSNNFQEHINHTVGEGKYKVTHAYAMIDYPDYKNSYYHNENGDKIFTKTPGKLTTDEWCAKHGVTRCNTIQEVIDSVDYIIVFSPDNSELHEALAQAPLRSGKPVFIDKAFAPNKATAERIFALAEEYNTPLFSSSSLRYAKEMPDIPRENIEHIALIGSGMDIDYIIHQLEPLYALMAKHPTHIMANSSHKSMVFTFKYDDGRIATITMVGGWDFNIFVRYADPHNTMVTKTFTDFFNGFAPELIKFFETGVSPVAKEDTIAIAAAYGAAAQAVKQPGVWLAI